jgi:MinD superfamily P-loop ATPase
MDEMATAIWQKQRIALSKTALLGKIMTGLGNPLARLIIPLEDKKFKVNSNCNGCGTCKKVCPVDDIKIVDNKPVWLNHCTQCAACFSWCPQEAIYGTNLAARTHYRNPNVKLKQMMNE